MDEMLIIVVDGSLNISSHWDTVKTLLESIVRRFCTIEASTSSVPFVKKYNLSLIVNAGLYDYAQSDGKIKLDSFLHSMSSLNLEEDISPLTNYGISEGLSLALELFQLAKYRQQTPLPWKQHCVIVTASHPSPDANKLAPSFIESFVSLSVICPKDMSTVDNSIDDAGNIVQYPLTIALKHPWILLFISEKFPEARDALKNFTTDNSYTNFSDDEVSLLENILSKPQMKQQNEYENMQIIPDDVTNGVLPYDSMLIPNISDEMLPLEPISHDVLGDNFINHQGMQTEYLQDELNIFGESIQLNPEEMEVLNNLIPRDICPFQVPQSNGVARSNDFNMNEQIEMDRHLGSQVRINEETFVYSANHPSQRSILKPNNSFHPSTSMLLTNNPEYMLNSPNSMMLTPRTDAFRSDNVPWSSGLTTSNSTSGTKSMFSTNMQRPSVNNSCGKMVVLGEMNRIPSMSYPTTNYFTSTRNTHRANTYNKGKGLLSTKAPGSRTNHIATSRVTNVSSSRTSCHLNLSQIAASPLLSSSRILPTNFSSGVLSRHIMAWEGSIASRGSGVNILMSKLVAYKKNTIPEKIFANWPRMMQLDHLVARTQPHHSPTQANKIPLVFKVLDSCPIWDHMKQKNLCGYVALPGQMLKLWISEDSSGLMGTLYYLKG